MAAREARALHGSTLRERQIRSLALMLALGLFAASALQLAGGHQGGTSTPRAAILITLILFGIVGAYTIQLAEVFHSRRTARERENGEEREGDPPGPVEPNAASQNAGCGVVVAAASNDGGGVVDSAMEAYSLFEVVSAQAPVGIAYFDRMLLCVLVNDALTQLDGLSVEQHRGRHVREILPSPLGDAVAEDMLRVIQTGVATNGLPVKVETRACPGQQRNWLISYAPLRLSNREIMGVGCTIEDVTERLQIERERERLVVDLREAVRARDDFLSIASHELRTPLSTLALGTSELIRAADSGKVPTAAQLKKQAERLRSQAQRLERLVSTVLDVSRIVQGRVKLFPETLDASAVVREHCERMREDASRAGATIQLTCEEQIMGCFDRTRLEQIVDNLLSNAIKFGAGKPIDVTLAATPEMVSLTVHDRGLGIAKEDQARIFERFERAVSAKHYGGLGLGLWVVRQIVESMGGTIFVTSELGKGSTFVVEWPRIAA